MKKIRLILGLLAVAATVTPPAATAVEFHTDAASGSWWVTNTNAVSTSHKFDAAGNTITCTTAQFQGTRTGRSVAAIQMTATYGNCTFFGVAVTVTMGNCQFEFNANGKVSVVDQAAKDCNSSKITFKASFLGVSCHVEIGEQTGLEKATYDGATTANGSVTLTPAITAITYTATGSGCGETGTKSNGNYTSGTTGLTTYEDINGLEGQSSPFWAS